MGVTDSNSYHSLNACSICDRDYISGTISVFMQNTKGYICSKCAERVYPIWYQLPTKLRDKLTLVDVINIDRCDDGKYHKCAKCDWTGVRISAKSPIEYLAMIEKTNEGRVF